MASTASASDHLSLQAIVEEARRRARLRRLRIALILGLLALVGYWGWSGSGSNAPSNGPASSAVHFHAPAGTEAVPILVAGDLTVEAGCIAAPSGPVLTVSAATSAKRAAISSDFHEHGVRSYHFSVDRFGRAYGRWDFLGSDPADTTGLLRYSSSGGGASVRFSANREHAGGQCEFRARVLGT